jgi:Mn-dependent DtxR family transcriptional regulator
MKLATNEIRIARHWQQMAITTADQARFLTIARYLGEMPATTTYMVSVMLRDNCQTARNDLRRMEKMGYVVADSNGSNSIRWSLKP